MAKAESKQALREAPALPQDTAEELARAAQALVQLLVEQQLLSPDQVRYAERIRAKLPTPKLITKVVQDLGLVSLEQLRAAAFAQKQRFKLGNLLVLLGYLGETELNAALSMQQEAGGKKRVGEVLVDGHFLDDEKLCEALSCQLGVPFVRPSLRDVDSELLTRIPLKWCQEHGFVPLRQDGNRTQVAFADPTDRRSRAAAEKAFGEVIAAMAPRRHIDHLLVLAAHKRNELKAGEGDESAVKILVENLLREATTRGASDIHIEPTKDHLRVRFRQDGVLIPYRELPKDLAAAIGTRIKVMANADITERRRHQDGRILFEDLDNDVTLDLRASFYVTIFGEKIVLRLLNNKGLLLDIAEIGMAPRMLERFREAALEVPSGVLIATGPTGSGKTTTLYASVNHLNDIHTSIVTAEDPVEYVIDGIAQCSIHPKIGVTFEETLRHIVRQDPDVIVLGEIRDHFSAATAIQAALTGHKVLTTFHTEDSTGGLLRLLNLNIEAFLISSTVLCVVAQRLLRRVCRECSQPAEPTSMQLRRIGSGSGDLRGNHFRQGKGCEACHFTGYRGRVGVFELLVLNEEVKEAILGRKTSYEIRRISMETSGLVTLLEDGLVKAADGMTTLDEIVRTLPRLEKPRPIPELRRLLGARVAT